MFNILIKNNLLQKYPKIIWLIDIYQGYRKNWYDPIWYYTYSYYPIWLYNLLPDPAAYVWHDVESRQPHNDAILRE